MKKTTYVILGIIITFSIFSAQKTEAITVEDCILVSKTEEEKVECENQEKENKCKYKDGYASCADKEAKEKAWKITEKAIEEAAKVMEEEKCIEDGYASCKEKICQEKYKTSCAMHADQVRSASGQNFKLPLDFLSLKTKGKDGKLKQQGKSIFVNKDYTKDYGVLIGTLLRVIDIMILVIGSVAMLTLIVGGIFMIANHGDEAWVTKGKGMMLYSILGLLFAFLSFALVNIITSITS